MRLKAPAFKLGSSYDVAFSPSTEWLATVGRKVTLWSVKQRRAFSRDSFLRDPSYVAFSPDGHSYAVKNTLGELVVCASPHGDPISRYTPAAKEEGCRIAFSADSAYLVDGSWNGRVVVRETTTLQELACVEFPQSMVVDASHTVERDLWAFAVSATHGHAGFDQGADFVVLYHLVAATLIEVRRFGPFANLRNAQLGADGSRLGIVHGRTELLILDVETGEQIATARLEIGGAGSALAWSPDGNVLAAVLGKRFTFFNGSDLREIASREDSYPSAVAFSADGKLLSLGSWEAGVVVPVSDVVPVCTPV